MSWVFPLSISFCQSVTDKKQIKTKENGLKMIKKTRLGLEATPERRKKVERVA